MLFSKAFGNFFSTHPLEENDTSKTVQETKLTEKFAMPENNDFDEKPLKIYFLAEKSPEAEIPGNLEEFKISEKLNAFVVPEVPEKSLEPEKISMPETAENSFLFEKFQEAERPMHAEKKFESYEPFELAEMPLEKQKSAEEIKLEEPEHILVTKMTKESESPKLAGKFDFAEKPDLVEKFDEADKSVITEECKEFQHQEVTEINLDLENLSEVQESENNSEIEEAKISKGIFNGLPLIT